MEHLDLHGSSITSLPICLISAQQLTFLGLSCCHSLDLDRWGSLGGGGFCYFAGVLEGHGMGSGCAARALRDA